MDVAQWAEIRRLREIENLTQREIASRVGCSRHTVQRALAEDTPPLSSSRSSKLDPYKPAIDQLLEQTPELSAVRILEEIRRGEDGYRGSIAVVRRYVKLRRPPSSGHSRVYQEVQHDPGQAMQIDWGDCHTLQIENTQRKVSVFVAVLCYSRMMYIEFTLSQRKAEFYRAIVHALEFFGGSPRKIVFDNLKAAVLNGHGKHAALHPEFLALCGHYYLEPVACARHDPESKGMVEGGVRYVKRNALAGRADELTDWNAYRTLAITWRDSVANVRLHEMTRERPVDRFEQERNLLRPLPAVRYGTDEIVGAIVDTHARVNFDANRYSVPPDYCRKPVAIHASADHVRILHQGQTIASHARSYARRKLCRDPEHERLARQRQHRTRARQLENEFAALGEGASEFLLQLQQRPVQTTTHLRRLLKLAQLYGKSEVMLAIDRASELRTYDAAYVESILLQARRQQELPSPIPLQPKRQELIHDIDIEEPDPAHYDRLCGDFEETHQDEPPQEQSPHEQEKE